MARLLILKAGSGASNNLIRSLKSGDSSLHITGCHDDRFVLRKSLADENHAVPLLEDAFARELERIIRAEGIDLVIPNSESDVPVISRLRDRLPCRTFLPRESVIERCQDKFELTMFLRELSIPTPVTDLVHSLDEVGEIFSRFASSSPLWCRIRKGSGSAAAVPVKNPQQAVAWIKYWEEMREVPPGSFTLSEYLPGRDITVQCLLKNGRLVRSKMHERLSYHVVGSAPSGVSSTAALAKMIDEPELLEVSVRAVLALDGEANGVFFVDLKEDAAGQACITEINAGRFANVPTIHDVSGRNNMALAYVRLALELPLKPQDSTPADDDVYVLRSIDTLPAIVRGADLFPEYRRRTI